MTKILILSLCAAALSLSSCQKKPLPSTPPPAEKKVPVGFRPMSQAVWVKSDANSQASTTFSDYHSDFGVWGIARCTGISDPYILWSENSLTQVLPVGDAYKPVTDAYWLRDYTYNFLALAPYTDLGVTPYFTKKTASTPDKMSFTYDLSANYGAETPDLDFDLMAAVAETPVTTGGYSDSQDLTFWHIFSQININVSFVDNDGNSAVGNVTEIRFKGLAPIGDYTISFDDGIDVDCTSSDDLDLILNSSNDLSSTAESPTDWTLNIIPQEISDLKVYIDFTQGEGASKVYFTDYEINLNLKTDENPTGTNPSTYGFNEKYNWNIKIGPKAAISFTVGVIPWVPDDTTIPPIDIK